MNENRPCSRCSHELRFHTDWWDASEGGPTACGFACTVNGCECDDMRDGGNE